MEFSEIIGKWVSARNRLCLTICAGNLLLVAVHFTVMLVILMLLAAYVTRRSGLDPAMLLEGALCASAGLIVVSTLVSWTGAHRPSFLLRGRMDRSGADPWADNLGGLSSSSASTVLAGPIGNGFLWYFLENCFYGSGRRLLRAFGIFGNWLVLSQEESLALEELLTSLHRRGENRPWFPAGEYPEALPYLEAFLKRDILCSSADDEGNLRLRLDRALWFCAGLPEPVAQPRARLAK